MPPITRGLLSALTGNNSMLIDNPLVIIESPLAGAFRLNAQYARAALFHSLSCGEAPMASHLLHTQVLDDDDPTQRRLGIEAGVAWARKADIVAFYTDLGMSDGMLGAINYVGQLPPSARPLIETRRLGDNWRDIHTSINSNHLIFTDIGTHTID